MATTMLPVFQNTLTKTSAWLDEINNILNWDDPQTAWKALRAVLHTLRDQLSVEEATDLSAQLPMLVRGLFFEGWNPARKTERIRTIEKFVELVNKEFNEMDFRDYLEKEDITRAVLTVLAEHVCLYL